MIASRQSSHREIFEVLPDGGIWIDVRLSPLINEKGAVLGVLGLSHNISERKHAEEALHESEMKYRTLVDSSNDIIYTLQADGPITFVSPTGRPCSGIPQKRLSEYPFTSLPSG